ncbi:ATP synthase subunit I [Bacillus carboniphilus]|uniref:ATP synthase subunit I n=1 Tax=Bacillus carboniphilus TaxID=86663 RepID=A0ABY9JTM2_9BACI|nr:ATP synthase subunit I [Bacillus carboniphilus]WLR41643.1 ATP synthase subunit I [Bacillus carboniphilus]
MQDEFQRIATRSRKYIFFLLVIYVFGWIFLSFQTIFLGLILGTVFSLYQLWLMEKKYVKFRHALEQGQKAPSIGTISRMALAALAVLIALQFPEYFQIYSVIIGLMTMYVVIIIDFFVFHYAHNREKR